MKILVAAGGTGGHIYPALALIDKFKAHDKNTQVIYVGTKNRMEKDIVPKLGIDFRSIEIYGLTKNIINDIKDVYLIIKDIKEMKKLMKEYKPDVVLAIGGYVTYPVIKAAHKLNIPIFMHEQNAIPGKVNKITEKKASLIGVSFEESKKYFKNKNVFYSGNPVAERALTIPKVTKSSIGFDDDKKLITIVAGSLGSSSLNAKIQEFLNQNKDYQILYITGAYVYDQIKDNKYPDNVKVVPYFDNLPGILKSTDVLITRAGASTIAEVEALGIPSIFVPSPYVANNHQYYNAKNIKDLNAGEMIEEAEFTTELLNKKVDKLLSNPKSYVDNLVKLAVLNSSELIYQKIKEMLDNVK
jgi:UDP-N-acetylglucosamine--N-acetylmuramyl-(pentapeptide) pyrophosphoryl-undecaprenol N-acetylglucosamine transferase